MSARIGADDWLCAVVVFSGRADLWWLRFLRPGFRHCFVALEAADHWLVVDPLCHRTMLAEIPKSQEFDLVAWYLRQGMEVAVVPMISPITRVIPFRMYSCVEMVKRIIGIHSPWVVTPWQLYRNVNKTGKFRLTERGG